MKRTKYVQTVHGQKAWFLYQTWMNKNRKQSKHLDNFINSRYYESFVKFANFVNLTQLDSKIFIWLMVKDKIQPFVWTDDRAYALYLEHMDRRETPDKLAEITVKTIEKIVGAVGCEMGEFFEILEPPELIQLVRQRRLTPWVLLNSAKFHRYYNQLSNHQRIELEVIIKPDFWYDRFEKFPEDRKLMQELVSRLKL